MIFANTARRQVNDEMAAQIATGFSYGTHPINAHAINAVETAMQKAGLEQAESVLLFMTHDYIDDPDSAVRLAARTAGCVQVAGAIGYGILTEEDWLLDSPGVAAMVFGPGCGIGPRNAVSHESVLAISTPSGFNPGWLHDPVPHIGAIASDPIGQGAYQVWSNARIQESGRIELGISHARAAFAVGQSFKTLTQPHRINISDGLDVINIDDHPALDLLLESLPDEIRQQPTIPLHLLLSGVVFGNPVNAIREGRFHLDHIISANPESHSITITSELQPNEHVFLAIRDSYAAELDMQETVAIAHKKLGAQPDFGLMFPCFGRGPSFYGGKDRDIEILADAFPGMPFIGFYGNGEIGPLMEGNHTYQYSTALGLFSAESH